MKLKLKLIGLVLIVVLFFGCASIGDFLSDADSILDGDFSVIAEESTQSGTVTPTEEPVLTGYSDEEFQIFMDEWENYVESIKVELGSSSIDYDIARKAYSNYKEIPGVDADSEDWKGFLGSTNNGIGFIVYCGSAGVGRLFQHYEKVKDNPFTELGLTDVIVSLLNTDNGYGEWIFDKTGDTYALATTSDSNTNKAFYTVLYDWIDKFEVVDLEKKKLVMEKFINDQINEYFLFNSFLSRLNNPNAGISKVDEKIVNINDPNNGLVIKYQGQVVAGVLGKNPNYEYTIDYNGRKDVPVKQATFRFSFRDDITKDYEVYALSVISDTRVDYDKLPSKEVKGLLVGDQFFVTSSAFDITKFSDGVPYRVKQKESSTIVHSDLINVFGKLQDIDDTIFEGTMIESIEILEAGE